MVKNREFIIIGILILIFDLLYNVLKKPESIGYYNLTILILGLCFVLFGIAHEQIIQIFRKIDELFETKTYQVLITILIISLLIRFLFLPERWINPDEGAHLYDAKFILDGKIPFVDYGSRMPGYVYILAAFLKVFGVSYMSGRLMPLFSNIGIGIVVFLIGKKLFESNKMALLASAIYLFSPLSILWSVVVKTEMPETLFVSIGMFFLITHIKSEKEKYYNIFLSGFFFALGYYVRESAIMVLLASLLIVVIIYKSHSFKAFRTNAIMLFGFLTVVFLIMAFFSSFIGINATIESSLNPINILINPIQKVTASISADVTGETIKSVDQSYDDTIWDWFMVLLLDSFLVFGAIIFLIIIICNLIKNKHNKIDHNSKILFIFLSLWTLSLIIFYIYYSFSRGFFTPYFGEVLPPLALIMAYVAVYFAAKVKLRAGLTKTAVSICIIIILTSFISSLVLINPSFECVWSPETIKEVVQYIKLQSDKEDNILSGAMIWTFESNTKPFMNVTHPLAFIFSMNDPQIKKIEYKIEYEKPKFIVLDGYTEKTYLKVIKVYDVLNESYVLKKVVYGSNYPIKIYELKRNIDLEK